MSEIFSATACPAPLAVTDTAAQTQTASPPTGAKTARQLPVASDLRARKHSEGTERCVVAEAAIN